MVQDEQDRRAGGTTGTRTEQQGALGIDDATAPYADPTVFLFLGGFLIAIAMQKWDLHRRIALLTRRRVGTQPRRIVLGMMITTAFPSMWVSNTATTSMMLHRRGRRTRSWPGTSAPSAARTSASCSG